MIRAVVLALVLAAAHASGALAWTSFGSSFSGPFRGAPRTIATAGDGSSKLEVSTRGILRLDGPATNRLPADLVAGSLEFHQSLDGLADAVERGRAGAAAAEVRGRATGIVAGPAGARAAVVCADGSLAAATLVDVGPLPAPRSDPSAHRVRLKAGVAVCAAGPPIGVRVLDATGRTLVRGHLRDPTAVGARTLVHRADPRVTAYPAVELAPPRFGLPDPVEQEDVLDVATPDSRLSVVEEGPVPLRFPVVGSAIRRDRRTTLVLLTTPPVARVQLVARGAATRDVATVAAPGLHSRWVVSRLPRAFTLGRVRALDATGAIIDTREAGPEGDVLLPIHAPGDLPALALAPDALPGAPAIATPLATVSLDGLRCLVTGSRRRALGCGFEPVDARHLEVDSVPIGTSTQFTGQLLYAELPRTVAAIRIRASPDVETETPSFTRATLPPQVLPDGERLLAVRAPNTQPLGIAHALVLTFLDAGGHVLGTADDANLFGDDPTPTLLTG